VIALYRFLLAGARFGAMPPLHLRSIVLCLLVLLPSPGARARDLVVFGEPTLESALRQVGAAWRERSGVRVNVFVAPSDLSFAQIERGARCDVVFALAGSALAAASEKGIVKSLRPIFRNSLMLIGRPDGSSPVATRNDPIALLAGRKLAIANPDRDPAGTYGVRWLREAGIPDDDRNIIVAENSAGVLMLLTDKMAQLGIVYATDAATRSELSATPLPTQSHPAIDYVVAEAMDAKSETKPFLDFLGSAEAKAVFKAVGLQFVSE
jgi:molybdenum ABC transporter molybdate-binding protein